MTVTSLKNTFNNGGNNRHGLKNVTCKQTFGSWVMLQGDVTLPDLTTGFFMLPFAHFHWVVPVSFWYTSATVRSIWEKIQSGSQLYILCRDIFDFLTVFNHVFHIFCFRSGRFGFGFWLLRHQRFESIGSNHQWNFDGNFDFQLWVQHTSCAFYYKLCKFMDM